jgi:two-component system, OmpR family, KDP operon response regulator KdpE
MTTVVAATISASALAGGDKGALSIHSPTVQVDELLVGTKSSRISEPHPVALLVEDEKQIRRFVRTALEDHGWSVHEADTMAQGLSEADTRRPDLVILDLGLPDGDGIDFLRDLRGWSAAPVIVLSARAGERDKIAALDAGADDYLTKPFGVGELLARVRAASRRSADRDDPPSIFEFGDVRVNMSLRTVQKSGVEIHLTPTEYRLLCLLAANEGKVVTHHQLLADVWGPNRSNGHYLRVYMGHLRHKLENDPARPQHILTEPAVGYRLVQKPRHAEAMPDVNCIIR